MLHTFLRTVDHFRAWLDSTLIFILIKNLIQLSSATAVGFCGDMPDGRRYHSGCEPNPAVSISTTMQLVYFPTLCPFVFGIQLGSRNRVYPLGAERHSAGCNLMENLVPNAG
jgi:hypothetical protein